MWRTLGWTLFLILLPVVLLFFLQRPLAAVLCPGCFGLQPLQPGVYVEAAMPAADRIQFLRSLAAAEAQVLQFYGAEEHVPRVLVCVTPGCYARIGGAGARVGSMGGFALLVGPEGTQQVLMAHELSHVELHGRVGLVKMLIGDIPAWFDEGVAVLASDDPAYLAPANPRYKDRCRASPEGDLPDDPVKWREQLGVDPALYAKAACRVDLWMVAKGGSAAVPALLTKVTDGGDFDAAFK